ncbi:Rhodanese-like domain-containing protein [Pseudomonas congelans]|nr:rhodanese-like domain-containing protein [Pseudomonas congelans]KFE49572.1 sulfurtransferase [Pseudomonas congelans]PBP89703.1 rhodanese-like domain-containing protein [Pseudomonas congelans]PBP96456.1 rhodanese-like domain-containing protein [Pseudomonas congelans]PBQ21550.1 rhodanese-like domain-containing protein [Pseudomonas congelans]QVX14979.1 rhodanese-like domain-containing protein [Pseudomonas congelans]
MRQWIAACALVSSFAAHAGVVDQAAAVTALKEGKLAMDVRSQTDYDAGTVLNAVRVDERRLVNQMKQVLNDRNAVFVIFSSTDSKADRAQEKLRSAGYFSVINGGNYEELHNALYDITDDPAE